MIINPPYRRACLSSLKFLGVMLVLIGVAVEPIHSSDLKEIDILVPVDPYNLPEGLILDGPPLKEIEVRVRGSLPAIERLSQNVSRYRLDLSGVTVGVESIPINPDLIQMPAGVDIVRINPAYLPIKVDRWMKKQVPVRLAVTGKPVGSHFVDSAIARPSSVVICGPETTVGSIDEILTKPVDCSGRSASFKKEIAPDLKEGVKVCSEESIILAEIYLAEKVVTRQFLDLLVEGQNTPLDYQITPRTLTLEIKGPQNIISNLQPHKDIRVSVELNNLSPGVYVRRAVISLPVKTTLVNVEPELFTIKINDKKP